MKEEYSAPAVTVELLEKADVLLSSGEESQSQNTLSEKENIYMDAVKFFASLDWFPLD